MGRVGFYWTRYHLTYPRLFNTNKFIIFQLRKYFMIREIQKALSINYAIFSVSQTRDASLTVRPVPAAFKQIKKVVPQPAYHLPLMTQFQLSVEATAAQMKILIIGPGDSG